MNYSIKILQDELNRINSAYERFVSKGTIETEHVLALANRIKARDLEQAITELKQALQLQQTGVMRSFYCDSKDCNDSKGALCNGFCKGLAEEPKNDA